MSDNVIRTESITKRFTSTLALDCIDFELKKGEIHGIVGQNGAGKSTLIKVISGVFRPDSGSIYIDGERRSIQNPSVATKLGIAVIHQHISLSPYLSVAENIFIGNLPRKGKTQVVDFKKLYADSARVLDKLGFGDINIRSAVGELDAGHRQMVQIARALCLNSETKVLILDEPSAILNPAETERLFTLLRTMRDQGISIIYVSHFLDEVLDISDRITVFKDGKAGKPIQRGSITKAGLIELMVGKDITDTARQSTGHAFGDAALKVRDLTGNNFCNVSFELKKGEVFGIVGLVGSGKSEICKTLFGLNRKSSGSIAVFGREVEIGSAREAIRLGVGYLPEDRKISGLCLDMTIRENVTMAFLERVQSPLGVIRKKLECKLVDDLFHRMQIKAPSIEESTINLSGGNQQKVSVSKWIFRDSEILILEEPTIGIDVGARYEIYRLIDELVSKGKAIIVVSSDIQEIIRLSDEVMVMSKGFVTGRFTRDEMSEAKILQCLTKKGA